MGTSSILTQNDSDEVWGRISFFNPETRSISLTALFQLAINLMGKYGPLIHSHVIKNWLIKTSYLIRGTALMPSQQSDLHLSRPELKQ